MADPRISIIIPCYNAEKLLAGCLDGVLAQEYEDKEVIVVDGGSTDGTIGILKDYSVRHPSIRWVTERDRGVYDAMNKGIGMATGEWVYFLGADDAFYDTKVLAGIFSGGGPDGGGGRPDILYGNVQFKYSRQIYDGPYTLRRLLFQSNICHQAIFYRQSVFAAVGLYDIGCKVYADRDFNIRCFRRKDLRIKYVDRIIAVYNEEDGLSAVKKADPDFRAKQEKYIRDYNNQPGRALVIRMRRVASFLKRRLFHTRKG